VRKDYEKLLLTSPRGVQNLSQKRTSKQHLKKWWSDFDKCYKSIPFETETREERDKASRNIENGLEDIMKYLRRIEQLVQPSVAFAGRVAATSQGLGSVFGGLLASLSPSQLDTIARLQSSDNAIKLAAALLGRKTGGRGMVKPEEVGNAGDEDASEKPDGVSPS
jgi:hypothetical protein